MLDTPFGFQENAPILAASTTKYFSDSVSQDVEVAGLARTDTGDSAAVESAMTKIRDANWVFAGPGSPTFALRQWQRTGLRDVLAEKLAATEQGGGGALVFSSAAALTLGVATVPVYEIYKVGMDPWWEPGLDLLSEIGINAAVIPHYDNQEGGNHDTRFCYLGERRLAMLEPELPDGRLRPRTRRTHRCDHRPRRRHRRDRRQGWAHAAPQRRVGPPRGRIDRPARRDPLRRQRRRADAVSSRRRVGRTRITAHQPDAEATGDDTCARPRRDRPGDGDQVQRCASLRAMRRPPSPRSSTSTLRSSNGRPTRCNRTRWTRPAGRCAR